MNFLERRLKAVPVLIALNVVVFLQTMGLIHHPRFQALYALSAWGLEAGFWWQIVTHAFLHGNLLHLLFNMMGLWFAGRIVERVVGTWRFLGLYFAAAVAGGLFQLAFGGPGPLIGASGAVFGVLIAFATLFPESQVVALVFFLPLRLRARSFGLGLAASSFFLMLTGLLPGIGHAAHFGGCVAGYFFAKAVKRHLAAEKRPPFLSAAVHPRYPVETNPRHFHGNPG
jgi:membrane associated rhomboid family serine protease